MAHSDGPRRVFITGMGVVGPHGLGADRTFEAVLEGRSAVTLSETGSDEVAAEVLVARSPFEAAEHFARSERMFMARAAAMAVVAAEEALDQAGLDPQDPEAEELRDAGTWMGCGLGGAEALEDGFQRYYQRRTRRAPPSTVPLIMANGPAAHLSMRWGLQGPSLSYSMACASSAASLGEAFRALRAGSVHRALAGGAEAMLTGGILAAWEALGVVARTHPDGPEVSCRPFDAARTGMVLGEGAAVFVLETEEAMADRGAEPLAQLLGYGTASDAHGLTEPHARGQVEAMREALADAGVAPDEVGYVNAHATGTHTGDRVETASLRQVFGEAVGAIPVSATKAVHGHLVGAAGALELLLTVQALRHRRIPPTAHLTEPDEEALDLDLVPDPGRDAPGLGIALSNSFAFGGSNAALVVGRV